MLALIVAFVGIASGFVGAWLHQRNGQARAGFIWGFILGPIGWLFPLSSFRGS